MILFAARDERKLFDAVCCLPYNSQENRHINLRFEDVHRQLIEYLNVLSRVTATRFSNDSSTKT